MAISENLKLHPLKQNLVTALSAEGGDDPCVQRLQALVAELLLKNESLRHQVRRDASHSQSCAICLAKK